MNLGFGVFFVAVAIIRGASGDWPASGLFVLVAAMFFAFFWMGRIMWAASYGWRATPRIGSIDSHPATVIDYRPDFMAGLICSMGTLAAFTISLAIAGRHGSTVGFWILIAAAALFLSFIPDAIRILIRRPHLAISEVTIQSRGWGLDARLDWSDVQSIGVDRVARRFVGRISGTPDARSWMCKRRLLIWPTELRPRTPQIDLPEPAIGITALDRLLRALSYYAAHPEYRHELGTPTAGQRLSSVS